MIHSPFPLKFGFFAIWAFDKNVLPFESYFGQDKNQSQRFECWDEKEKVCQTMSNYPTKIGTKVLDLFECWDEEEKKLEPKF